MDDFLFDWFFRLLIFIAMFFILGWALRVNAIVQNLEEIQGNLEEMKKMFRHEWMPK